MSDFVPGWFRRGERGTLLPQALAASLWSDTQMHGVAVSGLLALTLEEHVAELGRPDLVPTRYHVDLFRPARMVPSVGRATVVRSSARLLLLDAVMEQDGEPVARASALFLRPGEDPAGTLWTAADRPAPPGLDVVPNDGAHHVPFFASDAPWSQNFGEHQNAGRHATWQTAMPVVVGEEATPFQAVASVADATSMVTNWGSGGIEYINTDIDLTLARRPDSTTLGIRATDHVAAQGLAVGTAEVFDRSGPLGTATVTAMSNVKRTVDLGGPENPILGPDRV
ncbi:thioesterase family protein [Nocardioides sp. GY 10113]|uniref:acyl-CoA thioesterase domain-containing protein n=1 Tax=Nocardioides sp. GY 10113 TaxID=2569761 RepID=UPI0010A931AC|nr:acyl-CoA thioesterase domain-containing protein [Nocardioides sp. GY 10113]TIC87635.1 thioesterase family protein [Nocardioides sp. GY 10113]